VARASKAPFIATQLNSTGRPVGLSCVAINGALCVCLDGVSRAINTFYTRSPELIDSRIVRSPALFLLHASFSFTRRQPL